MPKSEKRSFSFNGFCGLGSGSASDTAASSSGVGASSIVNFRILDDGSLETRNGFRYLSDLGSKNIRALYSNVVNGSYMLLVLIGAVVYRINEKNGSLTRLGGISTSAGNACFFYFRGTLYLADGFSLYEFADGAFKETVGYVPLVFKDQPNDLLGTPHEPRNLLNRHARATFVISDVPSMYLCVGEPIASVEAVYVNQALQNTDNYSFSNVFNTINVKGLLAGDRVEVYFTYQNGFDSLCERLYSSTSASLFGGVGSNRLFLCGGNGTGAVFSSRNVSSLDLALSRRHYPDSSALYFPSSYVFEAGDGANAVTALVREQGHLLIFTEGDVWLVSPDEDGSDFAAATSVNSLIGCPVSDGATPTDTYPVSIGSDGIYLWRTDSHGSFRASRLSSPIEPYIDLSALYSYRLFFDRRRSELWLYSPSSDRVFICKLSLGVWYCFDGISADLIFDLCGSVAFIREGRLYVFDDALCYDVDEAGVKHAISASYVTEPFSLGVDGGKNVCSVSSSVSLSEPLSLSLDTLCGSHYSTSISGSDTRRFPTGKFELCALSLSTSSLSRTRISRLCLILR